MGGVDCVDILGCGVCWVLTVGLLTWARIEMMELGCC